MDSKHSDILQLISSAIHYKSPTSSRNLQILLDQYRFTFLNPLYKKPRHNADRQAVLSSEIEVNGSFRRLSEDFSRRTISLSDALELNEIACVELLWQAYEPQHRHDNDITTQDAAVAIFYNKRLAILAALSILFGARNHDQMIDINVLHIINQFTNDLLNQGIVDTIINLIQTLVSLEQKQLTQSKQRGRNQESSTDGRGSSTTPTNNSHFMTSGNNRQDHININTNTNTSVSVDPSIIWTYQRAQRYYLTEILFYIAYQTPLSPRHILQILDIITSIGIQCANLPSGSIQESSNLLNSSKDKDSVGRELCYDIFQINYMLIATIIHSFHVGADDEWIHSIVQQTLTTSSVELSQSSSPSAPPSLAAAARTHGGKARDETLFANPSFLLAFNEKLSRARHQALTLPTQLTQSHWTTNILIDSNAILTLTWTLFLKLHILGGKPFQHAMTILSTAATNGYHLIPGGSTAYKSLLKDDYIDLLVTQAVNDGFCPALSMLVQHQTFLKEDPRNRALYLEVFDELIRAFLTNMSGKAREFKIEEEEGLRSLAAYKQYNFGPKPQCGPHHFQDFLNLISVLYNDQPELAIRFWDKQQYPNLIQFVRVAGDNLFETNFVPYMKMLSALASGEMCSYHAFAFLEDTSRHNMNWNHFFAAPDKYFLEFQRTAANRNASETRGGESGHYQSSQHVLIINNASVWQQPPVERAMRPEEVQALSVILILLQKVLRCNANLRHVIVENPEWHILESLFQLLTCPIELQLKAHLMKTITQFARDPNIRPRIWQYMEVLQIQPSTQATSNSSLRQPLSDSFSLPSNHTTFFPSGFSSSGSDSQNLNFGKGHIGEDLHIMRPILPADGITVGATNLTSTLPLKSPSKILSGIRFELLEIESQLEEYPYTIAFLNLLNMLLTDYVEEHQPLQDDHLWPYISLVIHEIFERFDQRGYKKPNERWRVAKLVLRILLVILRRCNFSQTTNVMSSTLDTTNNDQGHLVHARGRTIYDQSMPDTLLLNHQPKGHASLGYLDSPRSRTLFSPQSSLPNLSASTTKNGSNFISMTTSSNSSPNSSQMIWKILSYFLQPSSLLNKILQILIDGQLGLADVQPCPMDCVSNKDFEACIRYTLLIIETVLMTQEPLLSGEVGNIQTYLSNFSPMIIAKSTFKRSDRLHGPIASTAPSLVMLTPLHELLLSRIQAIVAIAIYVTHPYDRHISRLSVSIIHLLTRHADMSSKLVRIIVGQGILTEWIAGYVDQLELESELEPPSLSYPASSFSQPWTPMEQLAFQSMTIRSQQWLGVNQQDEDEQDMWLWTREAPTVRHAILNLLLECATQSIPNLAQLLIGIPPSILLDSVSLGSVQSHKTDFSLYQSSGKISTRSRFHGITDPSQRLAFSSSFASKSSNVSATESSGNISVLEVLVQLLNDVRFSMEHPQLACLTHQLINTLLKQPSTELRVTRFLRSQQQDFFHLQLTLTLQLDMAIEQRIRLDSREVEMTNHLKRDKGLIPSSLSSQRHGAHLAFLLEQRGWLLKSVALELHATHTTQRSYTVRLLDLLFRRPTNPITGPSSDYINLGLGESYPFDQEGHDPITTDIQPNLISIQQPGYASIGGNWMSSPTKPRRQNSDLTSIRSFHESLDEIAIEQPRMKMCDFLQFLAVELVEPPPITEGSVYFGDVASDSISQLSTLTRLGDPSSHSSSLSTATITLDFSLFMKLDSHGFPNIDITLLSAQLNRIKSHLKMIYTFTEQHEEEIAAEQQIILQRAWTWNQFYHVLAAQKLMLEAWRQVLEVSFLQCYHLIEQSTRENMLCGLLETLLMPLHHHGRKITNMGTMTESKTPTTSCLMDLPVPIRFSLTSCILMITAKFRELGLSNHLPFSMINAIHQSAAINHGHSDWITKGTLPSSATTTTSSSSDTTSDVDVSTKNLNLNLPSTLRKAISHQPQSSQLLYPLPSPSLLSATSTTTTAKSANQLTIVDSSLTTDPISFSTSLPVEQLLEILSGLITTILKPGNSLQIRGNLCVALLNYLQFIKRLATPLSVATDSSTQLASTKNLPSAHHSTLSPWALQPWLLHQHRQLYLGIIQHLCPTHKLLEVLASDASDAPPVWKSIAYATLEALSLFELQTSPTSITWINASGSPADSRQPTSTNEMVRGKWISQLAHRGFLRYFLEALVLEDDIALSQELQPQAKSLNALYVFGNKMAMLLSIAQTPSGTTQLLEAGCLTFLCQMKCINWKPEEYQHQLDLWYSYRLHQSKIREKALGEMRGIQNEPNSSWRSRPPGNSLPLVSDMEEMDTMEPQWNLGNQPPRGEINTNGYSFAPIDNTVPSGWEPRSTRWSTMNIGGNGGTQQAYYGLPPPFKRHEKIILPILRLLVSLMTQLPRNESLASQVIDWVQFYDELIGTILRDRAPQPTQCSLQQLTLLSSLFYHLVPHQSLLLKRLPQSPKYYHLLLGLILKYAGATTPIESSRIWRANNASPLNDPPISVVHPRSENVCHERPGTLQDHLDPTSQIATTQSAQQLPIDSGSIPFEPEPWKSRVGDNSSPFFTNRSQLAYWSSTGAKPWHTFISKSNSRHRLHLLALTYNLISLARRLSLQLGRTKTPLLTSLTNTLVGSSLDSAEHLNLPAKPSSTHILFSPWMFNPPQFPSNSISSPSTLDYNSNPSGPIPVWTADRDLPPLAVLVVQLQASLTQVHLAQHESLNARNQLETASQLKSDELLSLITNPSFNHEGWNNTHNDNEDDDIDNSDDDDDDEDNDLISSNMDWTLRKRALQTIQQGSSSFQLLVIAQHILCNRLIQQKIRISTLYQIIENTLFVLWRHLVYYLHDMWDKPWTTSSSTTTQRYPVQERRMNGTLDQQINDTVNGPSGWVPEIKIKTQLQQEAIQSLKPLFSALENLPSLITHKTHVIPIFIRRLKDILHTS